MLVPRTLGLFTAIAGLSAVPHAFAQTTLYAVGPMPVELQALDAPSATTASIGAIGSENLHNLAWDDATQLLWSVDLGTDVLMTIDPADGTTTFIGDTGLNLVHGLAIDPSDGMAAMFLP